MAEADSQLPVPGSLWIYAPNQGAPIFFAIAFAVSGVGHVWKCYRYKSWGLVGLHPVCALFFTVGYALRGYGSFNHYVYAKGDTPVLINFILSQVLIYICPPLLELANYHVLGRVFYYIPYLAPLPPGRVLATFGGLMALVEALNAIGVSLAANPTSSGDQQHLGKVLVIAAISLQVMVIVVFAILAGLFHWRCARSKILPRAATTPLHTLYASMALIFVRCIYRLVEHTGNTTVRLQDADALRALSPLLRYEWYFYVFEATLMLVNSAIWNIWNPGRYMKKNVHLAEDGRTEVELDDELDDELDRRPLLAKAGNVLTFGMLFRKKASSAHFHQLDELPHASGRQV
ncbi:hypothetical protein C8A00DRAFT_42059 [Chaetomidium leptoderma]|uniref:RTA1 domain protein n=1 Tax=Chaetomidium leptoderma TaxID=669021 RepID=A0AAN6VPE8_9PEZI|nr:hypothetical protein C8A00DRAFT_42059 [Chaetomidium leptoderma]